MSWMIQVSYNLHIKTVVCRRLDPQSSGPSVWCATLPQNNTAFRTLSLHSAQSHSFTTPPLNPPQSSHSGPLGSVSARSVGQEMSRWWWSLHSSTPPSPSLARSTTAHKWGCYDNSELQSVQNKKKKVTNNPVRKWNTEKRGIKEE